MDSDSIKDISVFIFNFFVAIQDNIDYPKFSKILLQNNLHAEFVRVLKEQDFEIDDFEAK